MRYSIDPDRHAAIFGKPPVSLDKAPGRSRKCKVCGDWHRTDKPWPHNCRSEAPPRNLDLKTPQIAPTFQPFQTNGIDQAEVITTRHEKNEYMKRRDLIEHEPGIRNEAAQWSRELDNRREIAETVKRFYDTDKDYWTPEQRGEVAPTEALATEGKDVDLTAAEGLNE